MDVIRDSIENRADDVRRAQEEFTNCFLNSILPPMSQHGEMAQYNHSYQANSACSCAIEQAISAYYAGEPAGYGGGGQRCAEKVRDRTVQPFSPTPSSARTMTAYLLRTIAWGKPFPMLEDS